MTTGPEQQQQDRVRDQEADDRELVPARRLAHERAAERLRTACAVMPAPAPRAPRRGSNARQAVLPPLVLSSTHSRCSWAASSSAVARRTTQHAGAAASHARTVLAGLRWRRAVVERERALPARHRQVDLEQQVGVEQRAVQVAVRVVDRVALAQRVEAVALPGVHLPRERQRVEHLAAVAHAEPRRPVASARRASSASRNATSNGALWITSSAPRDELEQLGGDVGEARLAAQELGREAVHLQRAGIDLPVGAQVAMELPPRAPAVDDLDRSRSR